MSDFMSRDMLPDLWEEILKRHWTFLETEENIQKLEERKKLEGCLKEFLCVVPHDRKFFLPETAHVLRKSIREMNEFTAYKAIIAFESISQYANNLFTKPWRKEYHILKMYSGFYQHEIKSNLLDAGKLFEAMGYRRVSDEILVLDGPICPDQVTNVSRDAMAAYVECQIMKHIYAGLVALGLTCTWQDVFQYREKFVGGSTQSIKGLAFAIKDRRMRKEKLMNVENCFGGIQHTAQTLNTTPITSQCANCTIYNHMPNHSQYAMHGGSNGACALHTSALPPVANHLYNGNGKMMAPYPIAGYQQSQHPGFGVSPAGIQPHMSHSRSLEHYSEPVTQLPHRHSFDHQQQGCTAHHYQAPQQLTTQHIYESPYDCLDGASMGESSVSYAAVVASGGGSNNGISNCGINAAYAHPYNVSGNRYPLPYNISNQLNTDYATPNVTCNGIKGDTLINADNGGYTSVSKCNHHQPPLPPIRQSSAATGGKDFQSYRQRSFPPDQQLIDFDDRAPLTSHDFHADLYALTQCNSFDYDRERIHRLEQQRRFGRAANVTATYPHPKDVVMCHQHASHSGMPTISQQPSSEVMYGSYVYARPLPKADRSKYNSPSTQMTAKYEINSNMSDGLDNSDKQLHLQTMELKDNNTATLEGMAGVGSRQKLSTQTNEVSDMNYETNFEDFANVGHSEHTIQCSPTQASKNQDGVGSFESWNYVFQNLERSGYSKDLGERGDLLVQGLDLDSLNISNGGGGTGSCSGAKAAVERRRSNHVESAKQTRQINNDVGKSYTVDKANTTNVARNCEKREEQKTGISGGKQEKSILKQQPVKKTKSALKPTTSASTPSAHDNNNGNNDRQSVKTIRQKSNGPSQPINRKPNAAVVTRAHTQAIISNQNEWSCRFCTFLNPNAKRICDMCYRSKDSNHEATVSHTPTCV